MCKWRHGHFKACTYYIKTNWNSTKIIKGMCKSFNINVIRNLKKKKSRDPNGISHELIQGGGADVTLAITKLINGIKRQQVFPHCLQTCNITSIYQYKRSKRVFNQYQGIFRVSVFKNILDRHIFSDE